MPRKGKGKGPGDDNGAPAGGRGRDGSDNGVGRDAGRRREDGEGRGDRERKGKRGRRRTPRRPERWQEVEALVRRLEPEIVQVFRRHRVEPHVASLVLEEVVTLLLYRWGQIARPEAWILEMLERRIERRGR